MRARDSVVKQVSLAEGRDDPANLDSADTHGSAANKSRTKSPNIRQLPDQIANHRVPESRCPPGGVHIRDSSHRTLRLQISKAFRAAPICSSVGRSSGTHAITSVSATAATRRGSPLSNLDGLDGPLVGVRPPSDLVEVVADAPTAARSTASADLPVDRGSSPNPVLPYSETSRASSLSDPGRVAKLLSKGIGGTILVDTPDGSRSGGIGLPDLGPAAAPATRDDSRFQRGFQIAGTGVRPSCMGQ